MRLTSDHKPGDRAERARIEAAGGTVRDAALQHPIQATVFCEVCFVVSRCCSCATVAALLRHA